VTAPSVTIPTLGERTPHAHWRAALVDQLIEHPDVWARIADHAEAARGDAVTSYQWWTAQQLASCARILAAAPPTPRNRRSVQ
jgi:hypothetical protein